MLDRKFFWHLCHTIIPEWTTKYILEVKRLRKLDRQLMPEVKLVTIADEWLEHIEEHDLETRGKSRIQYHLIYHFN